MVKDNNPLEGFPIYACFPLLKPCTKCFYKQEPGEDDANEPLLGGPLIGLEMKDSPKKKSQQKKMASANGAVDPEQLKQDPYLLLGSGMIAYRDMLFIMTLVFLILTLINLPAMFYFSSYSGIQVPKKYMDMTLGNMGYSGSECSLQAMGAGGYTGFFYMPAACMVGQVSSTYSMGVNPVGLSPNNWC